METQLCLNLLFINDKDKRSQGWTEAVSLMRVGACKLPQKATGGVHGDAVIGDGAFKEGDRGLVKYARLQLAVQPVLQQLLENSSEILDMVGLGKRIDQNIV